jgi:hypothetical protein
VLETIERDVIGVFAGDDLGEQSRPRQALGNRLLRLDRDNDMVMTLRASILGPHMFNDE